MLALHELQQQFAAALYGNAATTLPEYLISDAIVGTQRLQIYRNNVHATLTAALAATYPVVQRLVGNAFFEGCAQAYITLYHSTSGNVSHYGAHFAAFLSQFPPAQTLAYLPDVARLEWACHSTTLCAKASAFPLPRLAAIAPEYWSTLQLELHPSAQLIASTYPILAIWQANQDFATPSTLTLTTTQEYLLVLRRTDVAEIIYLNASTFAFLSQCNAGATFDSACAAALEAESDLDLTALLSRCITEQFVVDFSLP